MSQKSFPKVSRPQVKDSFLKKDAAVVVDTSLRPSYDTGVIQTCMRPAGTYIDRPGAVHNSSSR
jgi:hypothetical protein